MPIMSRPSNQDEVSDVHNGADALARDKYRISSMNGVGQRDQPAYQTHIPERDRDLARGGPFGGDPLDDPPAEEQSLAQEPSRNPDAFAGAHEDVDGDE